MDLFPQMDAMLEFAVKIDIFVDSVNTADQSMLLMMNFADPKYQSMYILVIQMGGLISDRIGILSLYEVPVMGTMLGEILTCLQEHQMPQ